MKNYIDLDKTKAERQEALSDKLTSLLLCKQAFIAYAMLLISQL